MFAGAFARHEMRREYRRAKKQYNYIGSFKKNASAPSILHIYVSRRLQIDMLLEKNPVLLGVMWRYFLHYRGI